MKPSTWHSARGRLALVSSGLFLAMGLVLVLAILLAEQSAPQVHVVATQHVGGVSAITRVRVTPVGAEIVEQQRHADFSRLLLICSVVMALTALAALPLGWFASGRMLRPIRQITARARTISAGNLHERLVLEGGRDEFTELAGTLDSLLARLESAFDAQRRFVTNASHELRTPLTFERTLLQVVLADPHASAETLRATCEELLAAGRDQERLIEALLTLASSERAIERRERVDLGAVASRVLELQRPELNRLQIKLESSLQPAITHGDPDLIERLVSNVIDNSVQHNVDGGWVRVTTRQDGEQVLLNVENSGQLITSEETETMFEPFRRLGAARTANEPGQHGLGLSIVQAIADAHGAGIEVHPRPDGGLAMTITFPAPSPGEGRNYG